MDLMRVEIVAQCGESYGESGTILVRFVEERKFRLDRVRLSRRLWWRLNEVYADFFYAMCGDGCWGGVAGGERRCDGAEEGEGLRQDGHCDGAA